MMTGNKGNPKYAKPADMPADGPVIAKRDGAKALSRLLVNALDTELDTMHCSLRTAKERIKVLENERTAACAEAHRLDSELINAEVAVADLTYRLETFMASKNTQDSWVGSLLGYGAGLVIMAAVATLFYFK